MFRRGGKGPRRSELTAFIDEGSEMEGRYTFRGTVMLNGKFKGEISSEDTLIIGERAVIVADIRAGRVLVSGEVTGNVRAMERIDLRRTARVFGDVEAPVVVLEEGVLFEGYCRMAKPSPVAEVAPARDIAHARDLAVVPLKR
ncbi:MAG TPA: polymer-forming cytoskeletal protein [Methylomirabilota bacterium]|nr:polymer-forming cytoskeletal protein [Methylomirabilota bacterium]